MKKLFTLSLRWKITGTLVLLILFSTLAIGFYSISKAKDAIGETVGSSAKNITQSLINVVDAQKFIDLKTKDDMKKPYYMELRNKLISFREVTGLKYLYTMRKTEDGKYIYVVDGSQVGSEGESLLGDEEKEVSDKQKECFQGIEGHELNYTEDWGNLISAYIPIKDKSGTIVGIMGADFDGNESNKQLSQLKTGILIGILIIIIAGIVISQLTSNFLIKEISRLKAQVQMVEEGNLTVKIESDSKDEIGVLSQAFKNMVESMASITIDIRNNTKNVLGSINSLTDNFNETSKATEEINLVINEIASGSQEQVRGVDTVSSSLDSVLQQVTNVSKEAAQVSKTSEEAVNNTEEAINIFKTSFQKVNQVNGTVENTANIIQELGEKSNEIISFSDTISQIAKQTNLLALNAAIEAARAGEQGKGFAVVANEIKTLAEQSNVSSKQIHDIVNAMKNDTTDAIQAIQNGVVTAREGVSAVAEVDNYLVGLKNSSMDVFSRVKEILKSIDAIEKECTKSMEDILSVAEVSKSFSSGSQQAAASTEEQSAIVQQIEGYLENIRQVALSLEKSVNKFTVE